MRLGESHVRRLTYPVQLESNQIRLFDSELLYSNDWIASIELTCKCLFFFSAWISLAEIQFNNNTTLDDYVTFR